MLKLLTFFYVSTYLVFLLLPRYILGQVSESDSTFHGHATITNSHSQLKEISQQHIVKASCCKVEEWIIAKWECHIKLLWVKIISHILKFLAKLWCYHFSTKGDEERAKACKILPCNKVQNLFLPAPTCTCTHDRNQNKLWKKEGLWQMVILVSTNAWVECASSNIPLFISSYLHNWF